MPSARAATETEAGFTRTVIDCARLFGWRTAHFRPARTARGWRTAVQGDGKGFPDLVLVKGPRLVVAELKVGTRRAAPEQDEWLRAFRTAGVPAHIWRPEDWPEIERVLGGDTGNGR